MNEADTRANLIDPKLAAVGWSQIEESYIRREVICPGRIIPGGMRGKNLACDYVLIYRNKKLAVIEAKKKAYCIPKAFAKPKTMPSACNVALLMPPMVMRFIKLT